jgi:hypothetical protein
MIRTGLFARVPKCEMLQVVRWVDRLAGAYRNDLSGITPYDNSRDISLDLCTTNNLIKPCPRDGCWLGRVACFNLSIELSLEERSILPAVSSLSAVAAAAFFRPPFLLPYSCWPSALGAVIRHHGWRLARMDAVGGLLGGQHNDRRTGRSVSISTRSTASWLCVAGRRQQVASRRWRLYSKARRAAQ